MGSRGTGRPKRRGIPCITGCTRRDGNERLARTTIMDSAVRAVAYCGREPVLGRLALGVPRHIRLREGAGPAARPNPRQCIDRVAARIEGLIPGQGALESARPLTEIRQATEKTSCERRVS